MLYFESDYTEGAHPEVLEALVKSNLEHLSGYGNDAYTESARAKIREAVGNPEASVEFLVGGTQTNRVVLSSILEEYEGVIAANSGHVSVHEAGAIESSGHKVITLPHTDGKLSAESVKGCLADFYADDNHDHMVFPGAVYISHPTSTARFIHAVSLRLFIRSAVSTVFPCILTAQGLPTLLPVPKMICLLRISQGLPTFFILARPSAVLFAVRLWSSKRLPSISLPV